MKARSFVRSCLAKTNRQDHPIQKSRCPAAAFLFVNTGMKLDVSNFGFPASPHGLHRTERGAFKLLEEAAEAGERVRQSRLFECVCFCIKGFVHLRLRLRAQSDRTL